MVDIDEYFGYEDLPPDLIPIDFDLATAMQRPAWFVDANCKTEDASHLELFYPETGTHGGNHLAPARKICMKCPVRYECLEYGLDEPWGVWGGHSPSQRRKLSSLVKKGSSLIEASEAIDARSRDAR
jgi:WhiB family transcriptional regulator, redox-sensing transcriptional regulator